MKVLFPAGIALIAMVACTPQQPAAAAIPARYSEPAMAREQAPVRLWWAAQPAIPQPRSTGLTRVYPTAPPVPLAQDSKLSTQPPQDASNSKSRRP